jgi:hypothetical protein
MGGRAARKSNSKGIKLATPRYAQYDAGLRLSTERLDSHPARRPRINSFIHSKRAAKCAGL